MRRMGLCAMSGHRRMTDGVRTRLAAAASGVAVFALVGGVAPCDVLCCATITVLRGSVAAVWRQAIRRPSTSTTVPTVCVAHATENNAPRHGPGFPVRVRVGRRAKGTRRIRDSLSVRWCHALHSRTLLVHPQWRRGPSSIFAA